MEKGLEKRQSQMRVKMMATTWLDRRRQEMPHVQCQNLKSFPWQSGSEWFSLSFAVVGLSISWLVRFSFPKATSVN